MLLVGRVAARDLDRAGKGGLARGDVRLAVKAREPPPEWGRVADDWHPLDEEVVVDHGCGLGLNHGGERLVHGGYSGLTRHHDEPVRV